MSEKTSATTPKSPAEAGTPPPAPRRGMLTEDDLYLFNEGSHFRLHEKLGAHPGPDGTTFGVWAPNAEYVAVIGDFNGWNPDSHPLKPRGSSGIWEGFIPEARPGAVYKYRIVGRGGMYRAD